VLTHGVNTALKHKKIDTALGLVLKNIFIYELGRVEKIALCSIAYTAFILSWRVIINAAIDNPFKGGLFSFDEKICLYCVKIVIKCFAYIMKYN